MNRFLAALALVGFVGCSTGDGPAGASMLVVEDITLGTGATAMVGDTLSVHYIGTLLNGTPFDSSYGGQPYVFRLGAGQVIAGWDQGIPGMRVGGKRRLTIPPSLAYGNRQVGPIPPNSTLRFEIELLSIVS